ncbi:hypothetical protein [Streptomyces sp. URMC 129]|uniref:hypothetical protein n=1 Tax=Streptomyces sp. URMC 129 TaxID=3423407 RepID=UPI003F195B5F
MPIDHARKKAIRERMAYAGLSYREAAAELDDPRNEVLCRTCGWTVGMVCPECSPGCGCSVGCTGWRHGEFGDDDHDPNACSECGAGGSDDPYGECVCYEYDDEDQEVTVA